MDTIMQILGAPVMTEQLEKGSLVIVMNRTALLLSIADAIVELLRETDQPTKADIVWKLVAKLPVEALRVEQTVVRTNMVATNRDHVRLRSTAPKLQLRIAEELPPRGKLLYIAPISGGFFPNQLELIAKLCDLGHVPDIAMSTSGGNMAIYIALLCKWDRQTIMSQVAQMNDSCVVKPWSPALKFVPSAVWGLLKGSLYDRGTGDPFAGKENHDLAHATEVWTTAYNKTQGKTAYFTNKGPGTTHLTYVSVDANCLPLKYAGGDYKLLRDIAFASSCVPGVTGEVMIDDESYIDGGVTFASPFQPFQDDLRGLVGKEPVHIVYLNCSNTLKPSQEQKREGIVEDTIMAVGTLTSGHLLSDSMSVRTFLRTCPGFTTGSTLKRTEFPGTLQGIHNAMNFLSSFPATVLELAPEYNRSIDYTNFNADEVKSVMFMCQESFSVRANWFEN